MARCFTVEKIQQYVDAHEPVTHRRCRGGLQSLLRFVAAMGDVLVKVKRARSDATCGLCGELVLSRAGTACMVCGVWCVVCGVVCGVCRVACGVVPVMYTVSPVFVHLLAFAVAGVLHNRRCPLQAVCTPNVSPTFQLYSTMVLVLPDA
jgi:hypothetical protein